MSATPRVRPLPRRLMVRLRLVLATSLLVASIPLFAETPCTAQRVVARLDSDSRLAERFDAEAAGKRAALAETCRGTDCRGKIIVEGRLNPELFMPWELMNDLVLAYDDDFHTQTVYRHAWLNRACHLPLPSDFWNRLYVAGQEFFKGWENERLLAATLSSARSSEKASLNARLVLARRDLCVNRARALSAARQTFGDETFDRFLYEAVAPDKSVVGDSTNARMHAWIEGGCQ